MNDVARHASWVSLLVGTAAAAASGAAGPPRPDATIFVVTGSFGGGGTLVSVLRQSPWKAVTVATLDSPDAVVQSFSGLIWVVEPATDLIRVFDGAGTEVRSFSVGDRTSPRDILSVTRTRAYVTRAGSTHLYRVDPQTGVGSDVIDLGVFADADGNPDMERMATDGTRLFIQLRRLSSRLADRGLSLTVTPGATRAIADEGYDAQFGARPLKRVIRHRIENPIATRLLADEFQAGDTITVDYTDKAFTFERCRPVEV